MELGTRELVQFVSLVATLAGAFAVVKSQLQRVIQDIQKLTTEVEKINERLDAVESGASVLRHQVHVFGTILAPSKLEDNHREIERLSVLTIENQKNISKLAAMHNGVHPPVKPK